MTEVADSLGDRIVYTLDAMGNRTQENVFDPLGALAKTRSRVFDALSRLQQDIGTAGQTTRYAYDANGNPTSVTDPLNRVTTQAFDALNRLVRATDPGNGVRQYAYNGQDRITQVTDPRNLATTYTVSGLGDVTKLVSPDSGTTVNTYDAAGNLKTARDARSVTATYGYDALNRVSAVSYSGSAFATQSLSFQYDQGPNGIGRLSGFTDPAGSSAFTYSAQQRHGRWHCDVRLRCARPDESGHPCRQHHRVCLQRPRRAGAQIRPAHPHGDELLPL